MSKFKVGDKIVRSSGEVCEVIDIVADRSGRFQVWINSFRLGTVWNFEDRFELYKPVPKYTIEDIDYTGCHPVIADALKNGKKILCKVWDEPKYKYDLFITRYRNKENCNLKYITESDGAFLHAEPIIKKKTITKIKKASEIIKWLEDNDYTFEDGHNTWMGSGVCFNTEMIQFCSQEYTGRTEVNPWHWRKEWLEEV